MKRTEEHEKLIIDFKAFIKNLLFEDIGTVLNKTYTWFSDKKNLIDGFDLNIYFDKSTVNILIRFSKDDSLAFTLFENNK